MPLSVLLLAAMLQASPAASATSSTPTPTTRPAHDRDPWVFRCVLDDNARMLIISLGDNWWMAFDTVHCSIYKLWHGEIELTGAVYDTKHGPQPHAKGRFVLDGKTPIRFDVGANDSVAHWGGYELRDNLVTLKWKRGDATFKLTPKHDGEILNLVIDWIADDKSTISAQVPTSVVVKTDRMTDADGDTLNETITFPKSGPLTLKLNLSEANGKREEPSK